MDFLIKVGGSLMPQYVRPLYRAIRKSIEQRDDKVFFFPGGGAFADLVRKFRGEEHLSDKTTHLMALACLDQNAYLMADICKCACVTSLQEIEQARSFPVVIAPYQMLRAHEPFEGRNLNIDTLSSTSSAIYLAHLLKARFIIATDVDGVFDQDPGLKTERMPELLAQLSSDQLKKIKRGGPLDETISSLIEHYGIEAWVINGKYPERFDNVRDGFFEKGTLIFPAKEKL